MIQNGRELEATKTRRCRMGWAGTSNGRLLFLAAAEGFDVLVTVDRGIEHQQNVETLPIAVVVMLAPATDFGNRNRLSLT